MKKTEILCASQFIEAARHDLGLELKLQNVHLGRLKFMSEDKQKFNGYVCFYALLDNNQVCYMHAFEGGIEQPVVCGSKDDDLVVYQEFEPGNTFRAKGNIEWYYGADKSGADYAIVEEDLRRQSKLAQLQQEDKNFPRA